jgi:predicted PurR-regulated permease PerM
MNGSWTNLTRIVVLVGVIFVLVWLLWTIHPLIGPLAIAALLAYLLNPAVSLVENRTPLSRQQAVYGVYLLFIIALVTTIISLVPVIVRQAGSLANEIPTYLPTIETSIRSVDVLGLSLPFDELWLDIRESTNQLFKPDRIFRVINAASTNLAWVLVILVTTYYLLRDWERLLRWIIHLAPQAYYADLYRLHGEIRVVWQSYLRGQLLIMFLLGTFSGLGAAVLGLPRALLLGFLAGLLALFPSIGPAIATGIAALVAWFEGSNYINVSNLWITVLTVGIFSGVQFVEGVWLQPNIMGHRLRLHPGLVFIALVTALAFGSALLALMIVPLLGTCVVIGRYLHRNLLDMAPWPAPRIRIEPVSTPELDGKNL